MKENSAHLITLDLTALIFCEFFSPRHLVQAGSGAHIASYPVCTWGSFPGVKRLRREAAHLHPVQRLRMRGTTTPFPQHIFMVWCLLKQWICLHGMVHSLAPRQLHLLLFYI